MIQQGNFESCLAGTKQVLLSSNTISIVYPSTTVNLNALVTSLKPAGTEYRWFSSADRSGNFAADPTAVAAPGSYYAFIYDYTNNCYNTAASNALVTVTVECPAIGQVPLKPNKEFYCQQGEPTIVLNDYVDGTPPTGYSVEWYLDETHSGQPVTIGNVNGGNHYAFFHNSTTGCFNTTFSAKSFITAQVPILCSEDGCLLSTGCPPGAVNLNSLYNQTPPDGTVLQWFDNTTHSGLPIQDPTSITQAGDYYAFFYHAGNNCYNKSGLQNGGTDQANKKVTIVNEICPVVRLNVKVALQGAMSSSGTVMRNDLQVSKSGGLLPTADPYHSGKVHPDINDVNAVAGAIVDWIQVEIRDAANSATVLESKSLLVKTNGSIVDIDGSVPSFKPQSGSVRVILKHRNHLAIASRVLTKFSDGQVDYDFTTAFAQAYNDGTVPAQMRLVNGIWCMQNGDVVQNYIVNNQDITQTRNAFNQGMFNVYSSRDLNMNGLIDNTDITTQRNRFNAGLFSILIKKF
nr:hypothetical protein [uncultured Dyadobacter sp.]